MPRVLGNESAGEVVAVGEGVDEATYGFKVGDKVAVSQRSVSFTGSELTCFVV